MRALIRSLVTLSLLVLICWTPASAQFGKNKTSYATFDWKVYHSPHFDVYFYPAQENQLQAVVSELESAYLDHSQRLQHELRERVPVILYRTHREFLQTNVYLSELPEAVGAFAEPFQGRMVLPIDDPPDKRYKLIRHELVHVFQFDILYGESLRRTLRASPPVWLVEGMASYLADDEDAFDQMVIRDLVINNQVPSLARLNRLAFETYRFGNAIFSFIEGKYGSDGVRTFLFEYRKALLAQNIEKPMKDAFGLSVEQFDRLFARYLRRRYLPVLTDTRSPDEYGPEIGLSKPGRVTYAPELSPSGELIAAIATPTRYEFDVVVLSTKDGELVRNVTKGFTNRYRSLVSGVGEGELDVRALGWSPEGDRLAFFVKRENVRDLLIYDPIRGRRIDRITFDEIANVTSPAFSPDGKWIAFSGNLDGYWDIFRVNLESKKIENLTQDVHPDTNPSWAEDGSKVLYNRRIGQFAKIFVVDVGAPERKTQLTAGPASDIQPRFSRDGKWVYFASDRGLFGVFNLHRLNLADGKIERLTDVGGGAFAPVELNPADDDSRQLAYTAFHDRTFRVFRLKLSGEHVAAAIEKGKSEPQSSPLAPSRRRQREDGDAEPGPAEDAEGAVAPNTGLSLDSKHPSRASSLPSRVGLLGPASADLNLSGSLGWNVLRASNSFSSLAPATAQRTTEPDDDEDADLRPFSPPLELTLDPDRTEDYKLKWKLDEPQIEVGVTDDGRFLSDIALSFSDLLGNQRIFVQSSSVSQFANVTAAYLNVTRRIDWGAFISDYRDFYLVAEAGGSFDTERRTRVTSVGAFSSYPLSRHYRLEGEVAYAQERSDIPFVDQTGSVSFFRQSNDYPVMTLSFVGDTVRAGSFYGPLHGHRFRVGVSGIKFVSGDLDGETLYRLNFDYRGYQRVTSRSLLAFRLAGLLSRGEVSTVYSLGGYNQLRGFRYREFFGENVAYSNFEFRFPLFDAIFWSFGVPTGPVRAFAFVDVGAAWFEDEVIGFDPITLEPITGRLAYDSRTGTFREFKTRDENDKLQDVHASAGLGIWLPFLGLPMNWSFSRIFDGDEFGPWHSNFYIAFEW
ncbi:MAG: PD40 domain-containing protein [Acidobacteriota bacterium]|nr:MAG: PD40 domain-containing protein [Acidobacteriota bacterium]